MTHPIQKYGRTVLTEKTLPVLMPTPELGNLIIDMLETMYEARGLGLAAPQVGRLERICVIDIPEDMEKEDCVEFNSAVKMPLVMINPQILQKEGTQRGSEGCLSFPEIHSTVSRAKQVTVQYLNERFIPKVITVQGLLARAVQHETDHLDGILFIDHLTVMQKASIAVKLKKLKKENKQ